MRDGRQEYWFPAKRYGWGWGLPLTWQGWAVLLGFIATVSYVAFYYSPDTHPLEFFLGILLASAALIGICMLKGEPTRWRWGGQDLD